ncbi:phospholipase D-like domain-containing protein, partial [Pseudomonas aeruginosa]
MSRSFEFPREISLLRRFLLLALLALSGCASTPPPQPSSALPAEGTWLARQAEIQGRDHPGQSGFHLLGASEDAFVARAALIRAAQRSLDIQYYIVHDGLTTRALAYELLKAADRGVRVRILIDDTASDGWDYEIGVLSAHPNIQVRLFNPLHLGRATGITRGVGRLFNLSQQHRRMHNKLWLADGTAAIVGGRNLGDEYFNAKPEMNFTDLDLLGVGPIANQLSHSFDQYWNSAISRPIEDFLWRAPYPGELESARRKLQRYLRKESVKESGYIRHLFDRGDQPRLGNWLENLTWARAEAIWDAPLKVLSRGEPDPHLLLSPHLAGLFKGVQKELILVSAYFVPAKDGLNYL